MATKLELSLGDYLKNIRDYPLLTAEEERTLGRKIRAAAESDERLIRGELSIHERERLQVEAAESRERMIQSNLRLVISVAKNFRNRGLPMEDLVNEGNVGLVNAVDRFDPEVGSRFSTYAGYWIDQAIRRALQNSQQMIHIPGYLIEQIGQMRLAMRALEDQFGRPPSLVEVARHMQVSPRKAQKIALAIKACASRNSGGRLEDDAPLAEALPDTRTPAPADTLYSESDLDFVGRMLSQITEREAQILKMRYGLSERSGRRMTLKEIGESVGLTRERVRQIEKEARAKLEEYVKDYL